MRAVSYLQECHVELRPTFAAVARALTKIEFELDEHGPPALTERERIELAVVLRELIVNAVIHGCLEIGGAWQVEDAAEWERELERRSSTLPFAARRVRVTGRYAADFVEYVVSDDGRGFDPARVPNPLDPVSLDRPCGRGLLVVRSTVDSLEFNEVGNQVRLVKRVRT
ncbi:MAG: ATP-binding protein [Polyangiaceae bacterium]